MRLCQFCNSKAGDYDIFCSNCGKQLNIENKSHIEKKFYLLNFNKSIKSDKPSTKDFSSLKFATDKNNINNKDNPRINISDININSASIETLKQLDGLSSSELEKIISLRDHGTKFNKYTNILLLKKDLKNMEPIIKNININESSKEELLEIKELNIFQVNKIVSLQKKGINIKSFEDFQNKLNLTHDKVESIRKYYNIEFNDSIKNMEEIININEADLDTLKKIPYMNIFRINTILELRNNGTYITSFEDLKIKLNLTSTEINSLKNVIIINTPKVEKIDINTANMIDLAKIGMSNEIIAKIILNRNKGIYISSYDELKEEYSLTSDQVTHIKEVSTIIPIKNTKSQENKQKTEKTESKINNETEKHHETIDKTENKTIDDEKKEIQNEKSINKIDLNKANLEELRKVKSINLIQAKKIINLREEGNYIKSYDDLTEKISLNPNQLKQIQDETSISQPKSIKNRVVDI